jgi:hypothetical protein
MRGRKAFAVLAVALLCMGAWAAVAVGGKKKATTVVVNAGPVLIGEAKVKVTGGLNTATACRGARSMRLFLTDQNGVILATIDSGTTSSGGNWKLQAKLSGPPSSSQFLQVKAKKLTVGKFVCKADLSGLIPIQ